MSEASIEQRLSRVSSLQPLSSVGIDEISRNHRTTRANDTEDYTYQKTNEELNVLRECPGLAPRFVELFAVVFGPRDITQPINQPVGGWIQSVAYRQRDFPPVLTVSKRLCVMDLVHDIRYLLYRDMIAFGLDGLRKTQLDRTCCIAGLVRVPW